MVSSDILRNRSDRSLSLSQKEAPEGIDVVYDPVGGTAFQEALKVVNWGAHILIIGFASGTIPKVRPTHLSRTSCH